MAESISRRKWSKMVGGALSAGWFSVIAGSGDSPSRAARPAWANIVVDSHVHLKHGDAARTEYSAEIIVRIMDAVGMRRSVVFAMSTTTRQSIDMARAAVTQFPDRLIPYVYALPHYERPVIGEIEEALSGGIFRGIKIHAGECTLAEYVVDPVLDLAGRLGVPCLIDCLGNLAAARRIAQSFPKTPVIYAHMGRYLTRDEKLVDQFIDLAAEYPNVYLDTSGVVLVHKIVEAVARLGADRLIWGTDGPHPQPDLVSFAQSELEKVSGLPLAEGDKAKILGGNLLRLLRLEGS